MMGDRLVTVATLLVSLMVAIVICQLVGSEQIPLSNVLPKLQAIHEDTKSLLMKNSELKAKIQAGVKLQAAQNPKTIPKSAPVNTDDQQKKTQPSLGLTVGSAPKPMTINRLKLANGAIDYVELEEFNEWVDSNLGYAVKNTRASIDALKEEAQQNNGTIEYSEQAVQDGIEGVRYWQSAVIFQDKTLKNEKFNLDD